MRKILIASTSTTYGGTYLSYLKPELSNFFKDVSEILFIPYACPNGISYDTYTQIVEEAFQSIGKDITGIHTCKNPKEAVKKAKAIFVGGGNTFLLVSTLYKHELMAVLRESVWNGTLYLGTSAGSNITGLTMQTTNDMPIIYPPSFKTLGLVPFNINPHYLDPVKGSTHMGETRETRIKEFHSINHIPVIGLREGSWLEVTGETIVLKGEPTARMFIQGKEPYEIDKETTITL